MAKKTKKQLQETYKSLSGQDAPSSWTVDHLTEEINELLEAAPDAEVPDDPDPAQVSEKAKGHAAKTATSAYGKGATTGLVPIDRRLAIPGVGVIERDDWTDDHTKQYLKAYADRGEKALKQLIAKADREEPAKG